MGQFFIDFSTCCLNFQAFKYNSLVNRSFQDLVFLVLTCFSKLLMIEMSQKHHKHTVEKFQISSFQQYAAYVCTQHSFITKIENIRQVILTCDLAVGSAILSDFQKQKPAKISKTAKQLQPLYEYFFNDLVESDFCLLEEIIQKPNFC